MNAITTYTNAKDPNSPLDIAPVTGTIGAEIRGVTLSGDLDADTVQAIKDAVVRHKVVFFRDQHDLDDARHEAFAALFGDPVAHPTVPVAEGSRYLLELDSKEGYAASSWHTDVTFVDAYPKGSILRAITIPEAGGDTLWANGETAYEGLPGFGPAQPAAGPFRQAVRGAEPGGFLASVPGPARPYHPARKRGALALAQG